MNLLCHALVAAGSLLVAGCLDAGSEKDALEARPCAQKQAQKQVEETSRQAKEGDGKSTPMAAGAPRYEACS